MSTASSLPADFDVLEPFAERWALPTTAERARRRTASTPEEREAFFAAAAPLLDPALDHLDTIAFDAFSAQERRLMDLMLSLAHVALAVEIQGPDEAKSAPWRDRMRINRSTADEGAR
jgi:selenocysteine lyase/cysteine desulfurase